MELQTTPSLLNALVNYAMKVEDNMRTTTGKFIIGSVNKATGEHSISVSPAKHATRQEAKAEAARLAVSFPQKKFLVLEIKDVANSNAVVWE